ncbi:MAG: TatD family deoxyribonuclease [Actinobacteria bacterium]|nr:TatD family deoxyribonuclease [Actinomycetota bacterium]
MWVDSHCHPQLDATTGDPEAVLDRARAAGVAAMVVVGTDLATSREAVALADAHGDVFATVGLHPHDAGRLGDEWAALADLARHPRVVAVGEAGFDYHYMHSDPAAQEAAFRAQIRLAHALDTALVIHTREAWDDTFGVLTEETLPSRTVFHCFTGGVPEAERALALGGALSFSGIVSFKNAADVRAAAAICPADRLLVETDSPYLAPVPFRGKENEPAHVGAVGEALAAAVGREVAVVAAETAAAAARWLGVTVKRV